MHRSPLYTLRNKNITPENQNLCIYTLSCLAIIFIYYALRQNDTKSCQRRKYNK